MADELRRPVLVVLVVDTDQRVRVRRVGSAQDVLPADQLHVQAALCLAPEEVQGAAEDDDQAVVGVHGLGRDAGEVGGLARLHVADDRAPRAVRLGAGRVGKALDHCVTGLVQACDGRVGPALTAERLLVGVPVEGACCRRVPGVPGRELLADDRGPGLLEHRHSLVQGLAQVRTEAEAVVRVRAPGVRPRRGVGPVRLFRQVPGGQRAVPQGDEFVARAGRDNAVVEVAEVGVGGFLDLREHEGQLRKCLRSPAHCSQDVAVQVEQVVGHDGTAFSETSDAWQGWEAAGISGSFRSGPLSRGRCSTGRSCRRGWPGPATCGRSPRP